MLIVNGTAAARTADGDRFVVCDVALFYAERSGGIRTYLNEKARFARTTGAFEHHLVIPGKRMLHAGGRHELPSLQLAASNGYRLPLGVRAVRDTLRAVRPDVVILHDPFWRPLSVTREAHRLGAAVVAVHHASPALHAAGIPGPDALYKPALRRIYQHAYEHVDAVMSIVDTAQDSGRSAAIKLQFGLHPAFRPGPAVPGDHLLFVGRVSLEKRIGDILDAMAIGRWGRAAPDRRQRPGQAGARSPGAPPGPVRHGRDAAVRGRPPRAGPAVPRGRMRRRAWPARDVRPGRARGGRQRRPRRGVLVDAGRGPGCAAGGDVHSEGPGGSGARGRASPGHAGGSGRRGRAREHR